LLVSSMRYINGTWSVAISINPWIDRQRSINCIHLCKCHKHLWYTIWHFFMHIIQYIWHINYINIFLKTVSSVHCWNVRDQWFSFFCLVMFLVIACVSLQSSFQKCVICMKILDGISSCLHRDFIVNILLL
jgi:hypothetical protein